MTEEPGPDVLGSATLLGPAPSGLIEVNLPTDNSRRPVVCDLTLARPEEPQN